MKRIGWVVACVVVMGNGSSAWAARTAIHEAAESEQYGRKAGGMIGRGLLNASTCFMDILVNTVNDTRSGPPFVGTLTGVAKGVGCGVLRLGSGIVDVATFWVPGFNGFPVSDSYDNCVAVSASSLSAVPASFPPQAMQPPTAPPMTWEVPAPTPTVSASNTIPSEPAPEHHAKREWIK